MNCQLVAGFSKARLREGEQLKICVAGHIPICPSVDGRNPKQPGMYETLQIMG